MPARKQKRCHECPICDGHGQLTDVQLLNYLSWARSYNAALDQTDRQNVTEKDATNVVPITSARQRQVITLETLWSELGTEVLRG
jgi:hypothetical protein